MRNDLAGGNVGPRVVDISGVGGAGSLEDKAIKAQPLRVLILGDRAADAELLVDGLRSVGFEPQWTRIEAERGLLASLDPVPDLILAEWASAQLAARRALALLTDRGVETAVIIVSSLADEAPALAAMKLGAHDVVIKESLARLGPSVVRALREANLRREWRRLQGELALREASLDAFFTSSTAGLCILDRQLRYRRINETLAAMNGPSVQEHLGRAVREVIPQLAPTVEPLLWQVLDMRRRILNLEISGEVPSQPGILRHWVASFFPILDARGEATTLGAVVVEITDQKQAEENVQELLRKVKETNDQLRRLSRQVVSSQEEERRRLSRELHDQAGQSLTALKIRLKSIEHDLPVGLESLQSRLSEASSLTDATLDQIRNVARDLRPPGLEQIGLNATLEGHCRQFARHTRLAIDYFGMEVDVSDAVGICLYRVAQEALTNVVKHAEASDVKVALRADARAITLIIEDDGRGIEATRHPGLGLVGMRERLELLGGDLDVERKESGGTRLTARIPRGRDA